MRPTVAGLFVGSHEPVLASIVLTDNFAAITFVTVCMITSAASVALFGLASPSMFATVDGLSVGSLGHVLASIGLTDTACRTWRFRDLRFRAWTLGWRFPA
jgi:hypothetical protein